MPNISLIICTKDRPEDMKRLLQSIEKQTFMPRRIYVIDGSDDPVKDVVDNFSNLNIVYEPVRPPSLPKQRNVGISLLKDDEEWIGFLDDDLVLNPDSIAAVEKILRTLPSKKPLGGVGMVINNANYYPFSLWRGFFFLDTPKGGELSKAGCPTMFRVPKDNVEVDWLSGGVTFWKKEVLINYKFDEWFAGTGYFEDVDFSYRVSKDYSLVLCGTARCDHFHHPVPNKKIFALGTWQITSWWYFTKKFTHFRSINTLWGMCGVMINNFIMGLFKPSNFRLVKLFGNIKGILLIISGKALEKRVLHK